MELDGDKYVRGDGHYNDKCYFIAAARAAIRAGKRRVKYRKQPRKSTKKASGRDVAQRYLKRRFDESDLSSDVTVRNVRRNSQVVSVAFRMAMLKSNKSYLSRRLM